MSGLLASVPESLWPEAGQLYNFMAQLLLMLLFVCSDGENLWGSGSESDSDSDSDSEDEEADNCGYSSQLPYKAGLLVSHAFKTGSRPARTQLQQAVSALGLSFGSLIQVHAPSCSGMTVLTMLH